MENEREPSTRFVHWLAEVHSGSFAPAFIPVEHRLWLCSAVWLGRGYKQGFALHTEIYYEKQELFF